MFNAHYPLLQLWRCPHLSPECDQIGVYVAAGPAACVVLRLLTSLLDKRKKDANVHLLTELEVSVIKCIFVFLSLGMLCIKSLSTRKHVMCLSNYKCTSLVLTELSIDKNITPNLYCALSQCICIA